MKKILFFSLLLFCKSIVFSQTTDQYGKFETDVNIGINYDNPFDYDEIAVTAIFTAPSGEQKEVDGFFIENYDLNTTNGSLTPGEEGFKIRFSPDQIGTWSYEISKTDLTGTSVISSASFQCVASDDSENHGFVRKNSSNYLSFDDDIQYILVGENMAWQSGNTLTNYKAWLSRLSEFGGNFIRLWHAHWGLGIEWKDGSNNFKGLRKYQQIKSRYQDWLYDYCAEKNVYVMLCIQHHGQVSTQVNPNWNDSPYNVANGGSCQNTWDFFTDSIAIAHTKNRLRYIVARWGYSKNIMAWELFNEVEWTDNFSSHQSEIADWHFEMTDYLKSIDPYQHLVTTSYAHDNEDPEVWSYPEIDITQTHFYNNVPNLERVLAGGVRRYLDDFGKPTLTGEFGLGGSAALANNDPDGIHLHNSLWGALMGGGMGTGMTWWWESYVHPLDLYFHFDGVNQYSRYVPFVEKKLAPQLSYVSGAVGDLSLTPSSGWATVASDSILIDEFGQVNPTNATLGLFLYGSQWNTQYRSPPSFHVTYPDDGYFEVNTSSESGQAAKIAIWVDSILILDTLAVTDTTYQVGISAGEHIIKVDNTGTDWISISSYNFSDLGSQVDSYVLTSEDKDYAAGWVLNNEYNHENVVDNGNPDPAIGAAVTIPDFQAGSYFITWLDCLTGEILNAEPVVVDGNGLVILVPDLYWDAAFVVDVEEVVTVANVDRATFKLFPNPAMVGNNITLTGLNMGEKLEVSLIDMTGRNIRNYNIRENTLDGESLELTLPNNLSAGMYWVKVQDGNGKIMAQAVMVGRE